MESNSNEDLINKLSQATEDKTPGAQNMVLSSDFFDQKEEEEKNPVPEEKPEPKKTAPTTTKATEQAPEEPEETAPPVKKISKDVKEASARTAVGMLDFTQKLIFTPILNYKFKKKFSPEEIDRLDSGVEDAKKDDLDAEDLKLRNKWDRLLKKHIKKIEAVPLEETEKSDLEKAFYNYMDVKEKTLPPEYFLGLTIVTVLGKRAIDVFID